jgi:hypothetical protein
MQAFHYCSQIYAASADQSPFAINVVKCIRVDLFSIFIVIQVLIRGVIVAATASYVAKKD